VEKLSRRSRKKTAWVAQASAGGEIRARVQRGCGRRVAIRRRRPPEDSRAAYLEQRGSGERAVSSEQSAVVAGVGDDRWHWGNGVTDRSLSWTAGEDGDVGERATAADKAPSTGRDRTGQHSGQPGSRVLLSTLLHRADFFDCPPSLAVSAKHTIRQQPVRTTQGRDRTGTGQDYGDAGVEPISRATTLLEFISGLPTTYGRGGTADLSGEEQSTKRSLPACHLKPCCCSRRASRPYQQRLVAEQSRQPPVRRAQVSIALGRGQRCRGRIR
jgi:hypothetical protein